MTAQRRIGRAEEMLVSGGVRTTGDVATLSLYAMYDRSEGIITGDQFSALSKYVEGLAKAGRANLPSGAEIREHCLMILRQPSYGKRPSKQLVEDLHAELDETGKLLEREREVRRALQDGAIPEAHPIPEGDGPETLQHIGELVQREHCLVAACLRRSLEHMRRAGELLAAAKARLPHGGWLPWLKDQACVSPRVAQNYMRLAAWWEEVATKYESDSYLTLRTALDLIAEAEAGDNPAEAAEPDAGVEEMPSAEMPVEGPEPEEEPKERRLAVRIHSPEAPVQRVAIVVAERDKRAEPETVDVEVARAESPFAMPYPVQRNLVARSVTGLPPADGMGGPMNRLCLTWGERLQVVKAAVETCADGEWRSLEEMLALMAPAIGPLHINVDHLGDVVHHMQMCGLGEFNGVLFAYDEEAHKHRLTTIGCSAQLVHLHRCWNNASSADRAEFLQDIARSEEAQALGRQGAIARHPALSPSVVLEMAYSTGWEHPSDIGDQAQFLKAALRLRDAHDEGRRGTLGAIHRIRGRGRKAAIRKQELIQEDLRSRLNHLVQQLHSDITLCACGDELTPERQALAEHMLAQGAAPEVVEAFAASVGVPGPVADNTPAASTPAPSEPDDGPLFASLAGDG